MVLDLKQHTLARQNELTNWTRESHSELMEESLKKEFRDAGGANSKKKAIAASTKDRKGTW